MNDELRDIANHLVINSHFVDSLDLFNGKMGIVIFFMHYSRYTGEKLYEDIANDLIDMIYNDLDEDTPINFGFGLCGIGWTIEYLLEEGFIKGDPDEILSELDEKIMERDIERIKDISLDTGIKGILYYINKRLNSPFRKSSTLPFDISYLDKVKIVSDEINLKSNVKDLIRGLLKDIKKDRILMSQCGLVNGYAGYGLKIILGL